MRVVWAVSNDTTRAGVGHGVRASDGGKGRGDHLLLLLLLLLRGLRP